MEKTISAFAFFIASSSRFSSFFSLQFEQNTSNRFSMRSFHSVVRPSQRVVPVPTMMFTLSVTTRFLPHLNSFFTNSSSHNSLYSFTITPLL